MPAEMLVPCAFVGITAFRIVAIHIGLTRKPPPENKLFFQTIHAVHLAGRCTGCGECQRACPVGIPILALRQHIARTVSELFDEYKSGMNQNAVPPLLTYATEEKNIHERDL